ncbi:hypothetical protein AAG906_020918 [Vitis piasezkii]
MTTHHVQDPTVIHFTIDGRHGILGARQIAEALKELLPSMFLLDVLLHSNIFPLQHMRVDAIPLLFPRLLCQILEHLGYPSKPQLKRRRICREIFTLDKWTNMTAYVAHPGAPSRLEHPEIPQDEQIQQHLGILSPPEHDMSGPSEPINPSQDAPPVKQTTPHEETTIVDVKTPISSTQTSTAKPSSPHNPSTTT